MKIIVLNGSSHPDVNTAALIEAFAKGASENRNEVTVVDVCRKKITGCLPCKTCQTKGVAYAYKNTICRMFILSGLTAIC